MAMAAIPAVLEGAMYGAQALSAGSYLGNKYAPQVRKLANTAFSQRKRKSALNYVKGLGTKKGLQKFVTKDLGRAAGATSKFITSGKAMKKISGIANDAQLFADVARPLMGDEAHSALTAGIGSAHQTASHFHQVAEGYNEQAKGLHQDFKDALKPSQMMANYGSTMQPSVRYG